MAKSGQNRAEMDLQFPLEGVDEQRSFTRQRPGTTIDAMNVRSFEPVTGRARGSQRAGLVKQFPTLAVTTTDLAGNADNQIYSIQCLDHLISTELAPPSQFGKFTYSQGASSGFGIGNGASGSSIASGIGAVSSFQLACSCWDEANNAYVAEVNTSTGAVTIYAVDSSGTTLWTNTTLTCATGSLRNVAGMVVIGQYLFVATATVSGSTARIARINKGTGAIASGDATWRVTGASFGITWSTNAINCLGAIGTNLILESLSSTTNAFIMLVDSNSAPGVTYVAFLFHNATPTNARTKIVTDGTTFIYAICSVPQASGQLRKFNLALALQWNAMTDGAPQSLTYDKKNSRLVVAAPAVPNFRFVDLALGTTLTSSVSAGTTIWDDIDGDGQGTIVAVKNASASNNVIGLSVGITGTTPTIATLWGASTFANTTLQGFSVNKGNSGTPPVLGSRLIRPLVMAGGELRLYSSTGTTALTGGRVFSKTAKTVFSAQLGTNMFFADRAGYYYYKGSTNTVLAWTATAGTVPLDSPVPYPAGLICMWLDCIMLAGFQGNPQQWYLSKTSDAFDWNSAGTALTRSTYGTVSPAGIPGDKITCLIPYNDDTLIFGCDHSIYQMTGDPRAGGRIDRISSSIGMAWGRPYAISGDGEQIYFMSNTGAIYKMTPGAMPTRVSQQIDKRLENIDLSKNCIRMAWDIQMRALYVFINPINPLTDATHFLYEERTNSWMPFSFADRRLNPFAVHVFDGDAAEDRRILLGGRDGYVRRFSDDAEDDDGRPISSYVWLGPITTKQRDDVKLETLQAILAQESADVTFAIHAGRTEEEAYQSEPVMTGTWGAGRNSVTPIRVSGFAIFVKLSATAPWALERITAIYQTLGMVRRRN